MKSKREGPVELHPDDDPPAPLSCPDCQFVRTPNILLARRTSDLTGHRHYGLVGCEHAKEIGEWMFPPWGFTTSRKDLAEAWNSHVRNHPKYTPPA